MEFQVIERDGQPEYAVVPWAQFQALLQAAGQVPAKAPKAQEVVPGPGTEPAAPALAQLRSLREAKGVAPEALARNVGISPAYLAMIEAGEREPGAAIRRALAWHLGVPGWSDEP